MVKVGQVWKDCYGDGKPVRRGSEEKRHNQRTVRVIEQESDGRWVLQMLTDTSGRPPRHVGRRTRVQEKTLLSGYKLLTEAA